MTRSVLRDPDLDAQFSRDGFVRVPMLDDRSVAELIQALGLLHPEDRWHPDGSGLAQNSYHCSFLDQSVEYKRKAFALMVEVFAPVVERHLAGYRPLSANFYVKPTGTGRIPVHQNWPVLEQHGDTSVTVWCPLVDVDEANGTLHVVPGSHKLLPHVEGPCSPPYFADFVDDLDDLLQPLSAKAGSGFIFDDGLVHGSPDNRGPDPRIAVQITCIPEEMEPVFFFRRDDETFDLIAADREFYTDQSIADLVSGMPHWRKLGSVRSQNRQIGKSEFISLLGKAPPRASVLRRAASFIRRLVG